MKEYYSLVPKDELLLKFYTYIKDVLKDTMDEALIVKSMDLITQIDRLLKDIDKLDTGGI